MPGAPLPDKLFFKIGEVARVTGLAPYVLRYWETEFPQIRPRKGKGGQRVYRREDVETILTVRDLLHGQGFTIAGARKRLKEIGALEARSQSRAPQSPTDNVVENTREGLRELLDLMDNTDSSRA
ncbi:MAG: MerR family transcriptional regulator [Leptospirillia bacterium]